MRQATAFRLPLSAAPVPSALGGVSGANYATVTGAATTTALAAGDVTLNGIQVGASTAGGAAGQSAASAYSIAAAINAVSGQSGVTASAQATSYSWCSPYCFRRYRGKYFQH